MKYKVLKILVLLTMLIALSSFLPEYLHKKAEINYGNNGRYSLLNINDISGFIYRDGKSGNSPNGDAGIFYPAGGAGVVFIEGVLWGGYVNDPDPNRKKLRVGGQTYNVGTIQGRIISPGVAQDPDDEHLRVYRIRKDWQNLKENNAQLSAEMKLLYDIGSEVDSTVTAQEIIDQYQKDWQEWPAEYGAPFYDLNKNGIYEPGLGETPGLAGADQVLWFVVNDLSESRVLKLYGSPSIGLELQITLWGYNQPDLPLGQASFRRYRIINKSGLRIDSMFVGVFSDPDIGDYANDYMGTDTVLQLGYAYNSEPFDKEFDARNMYPPAVGYQLLQGPLVPKDGGTALWDFKEKPGFVNLPLTSVAKNYNNYMDELPRYRYTQMKYNWLNGFKDEGDTVTYYPYYEQTGPNAGKITKFNFSGDPVSQTGDVDGPTPGDRRFLMSSGPFTMAPGDTQEVIYALIGGVGTKYQNFNVEILKTNARYIKEVYPHFPAITPFTLKPRLSASSVNGIISIDWGNDPQFTERLEADNPEGNFFFEGYKVWQLPSPEASKDEAVMLATFDKESAPGKIYGKYLDTDYGYYLTIPYAFGTNSGIQRYFTATRDYFAEKPFADGEKYTFAVSAYRYSPDPLIPFPLMESDLSKITVVAHKTNPGYKAKIGSDLPVTHLGKSTGQVTAEVINPALLTGHRYSVSFNEHNEWTLTDMDLDEVKLSAQRNQSGDLDYPIIDGVLVRVAGADSNDIAGWYDTADSDSFRVLGVDWGGRFLGGGLDLGDRFLGSTVSRDSLEPVRLEFQSLASVRANGFIGEGAVYRKDLNYSFSGVGQLPLAAYSLSDSLNPRRLNICFSEMLIADSLSPNLTWDMGSNYESTPGTQAGYEALFIMKSDYDGGENYNNLYKGINADVLYVLWLRMEPAYSALKEGYRFTIEAQLKNTTGDIFTYTAPGEANVPEKFRLYQNYPNPFNGLTTFRYWIEKKTTVHLTVYNIQGQKIANLVNRKQEKGEYFVKWRPQHIASGVYIYRIQTGDGFVRAKKCILIK